MEHRILALCDPEEDYAGQLAAFLQGHKEFPWEVQVYTGLPELADSESAQDIDLLVVAESVYGPQLPIDAPTTVLLNESGLLRWSCLKNVDKYQPAENVLKELLQVYMEREEMVFPRLETGRQTKLVGMYSPVRRCLQTSFALTYGQILAERHRTLYLNFEHYAGMPELLSGEKGRDLSTLLYHMKSDQEKFAMHMKVLIQKKGRLDYIAPAYMGQNLIYITAQEWLQLLWKIGESGEYDYVILDLSENMQGLLEILRQCCRVYMLIKEDPIARCKIDQYEHILSLYEYEDIQKKTRKYRLPLFHQLPDQIEQYTRGDLAEYVRALIEEEQEDA
ncbi:MAG: hypothetical protein NC543_12940 [bacterium]|nr:hypothetical protein [bacterium]MCM1374700.1 hypothetical protein [Muribaculum sp.]